MCRDNLNFLIPRGSGIQKHHMAEPQFPRGCTLLRYTFQTSVVFCFFLSWRLQFLVHSIGQLSFFDTCSTPAYHIVLAVNLSWGCTCTHQPSDHIDPTVILARFLFCNCSFLSSWSSYIRPQQRCVSFLDSWQNTYFEICRPFASVHLPRNFENRLSFWKVTSINLLPLLLPNLILFPSLFSMALFLPFFYPFSFLLVLMHILFISTARIQLHGLRTCHILQAVKSWPYRHGWWRHVPLLFLVYFCPILVFPSLLFCFLFLFWRDFPNYFSMGEQRTLYIYPKCEQKDADFLSLCFMFSSFKSIGRSWILQPHSSRSWWAAVLVLCHPRAFASSKAL